MGNRGGEAADGKTSQERDQGKADHPAEFYPS